MGVGAIVTSLFIKYYSQSLTVRTAFNC